MQILFFQVAGNSLIQKKKTQLSHESDTIVLETNGLKFLALYKKFKFLIFFLL